MIDTPTRTQTNGTPRRQDVLGPDERVAALVHQARSPLAAIWNAVHLLSLARDETTVDKARQLITRQLERLVQILDDRDAGRSSGGGPGWVSADGDGRRLGDTSDA